MARLATAPSDNSEVLQRLGPDLVRHEEDEDWKLRTVHRTTVRYSPASFDGVLPVAGSPAW